MRAQHSGCFLFQFNVCLTLRREVRQRGFDIIYEARDLDLDQSERDGLTQYRTNIDSTKKRIKESEKRIDNVLPGKIQKKYW